jgi:hypothetical protein
MPRNRIDANVRCPSCNGQLYPRVLVCDSCGLKVEGDFVMNEFGALTPDELHFLRVFIYCEGRIRDMEAALGVSYPTVKGHLASIKEKLNLANTLPSGPPGARGSAAGTRGNTTTARVEAPAAQGDAPAVSGPPTPDEVLDGLEAGQISYKDAIRLLKAGKKEAKGDEQHGG